MLPGLQDATLPASQSTSSLTISSLSLGNLRVREMPNQESSLGSSESVPSSSSSLSLSTRSSTGQVNLDSLGSTLSLPRRFSSYAERISTAPSFTDGTSLPVGSPKIKKTGAETREELLNSWMARSDRSSSTAEAATLSSMNVRTMRLILSIYYLALILILPILMIVLYPKNIVLFLLQWSKTRRVIVSCPILCF